MDIIIGFIANEYLQSKAQLLWPAWKLMLSHLHSTATLPIYIISDMLIMLTKCNIDIACDAFIKQYDAKTDYIGQCFNFSHPSKLENQ